MFGIYKTVLQPTVIDDAVYCEFLSPFDTNLITAGGNRLQIYRVVSNNSSSSVKSSKKTKLELIRSFYLYANINSIASCRYGSMAKDALIISFADARVSVVAYDQATADLMTISAHYFEDEMEDVSSSDLDLCKQRDSSGQISCSFPHRKVSISTSTSRSSKSIPT